MVTVTLSSSVEATLTVPKSSAVGLRVIGDADDMPTRVRNSSEMAESDWISSVPGRSVAVDAMVGAN